MNIMVLGLSCSGKTTLSDDLGQLLNLQVYHLDSYFWKSAWIRNENFDIDCFIGKSDSIIDGNYFEYSFIERVEHCDYVIYVDCNIFVRVIRMLKRHMSFIFNPIGKNAISQKITAYFVFSTIYKQLFYQPEVLRYLKCFYPHKLIYIKNVKYIRMGVQYV